MHRCFGISKFLVLSTLAMLCAAFAASAAEPTSATTSRAPAPRSLLYVGNSFYYYNNSLHNVVGRLLARAQPAAQRSPYRSHSVTISGGHLRWHDVRAYLEAGIGSSAFDENNELVSTDVPYTFDAVMMMDCSRCPFDELTRPTFHEYAKKHSETVRAKGATPIFFMTWAYSDKPEMTEVLAREYVAAGRENSALVVPAGLAFARALEGRPGLALHVSDRRHPSPAGTYLAACTVLASVYGIDPRGNPHLAGLPAKHARYLQNVAWETVRDFRGD